MYLYKMKNHEHNLKNNMYNQYILEPYHSVTAVRPNDMSDKDINDITTDTIK